MDKEATSGPPFLLFYAVRAIRIPPACAGAEILRNGGFNEQAGPFAPCRRPALLHRENGAKRKPAALAGCAARPSRALRIRHEKAERYQNQERIQGLKMPLGAGFTKTMRYENRS